MCLAVMSNEGHVMEPHFFEPKQRVNKEVYLSVMKDKVVPWMKRVARGREYTWQQDSAPCHTAKIVLKWLRENVPHFWSPWFWPPNSPDCNPCDYWLWKKVVQIACKTHHNSVELLKNAIREAFRSLKQEEVAKEVMRFRHRIEAVVKANGVEDISKRVENLNLNLSVYNYVITLFSLCHL